MDRRQISRLGILGGLTLVALALCAQAVLLCHRFESRGVLELATRLYAAYEPHFDQVPLKWFTHWLLPLPPLPGVAPTDYNRLVAACRAPIRLKGSPARGEDLLVEATWVFLDPSSEQPEMVLCSNLGDQFRLQLLIQGEARSLIGQARDERTLGFTLKKGLAKVVIPASGAKGWYRYWITEDPVQSTQSARDTLASLQSMRKPLGSQGNPISNFGESPKTKLLYSGRVFLYASEDPHFLEELAVYNKNLEGVVAKEHQFTAGVLTVLRSVSAQLEAREGRFFRETQRGHQPSLDNRRLAQELALVIRTELEGLSAKLNGINSKDQIFVNRQYGSAFQLMHASIGTLQFEAQELARLMNGKFVLSNSEISRIHRLRVESKLAMSRLDAILTGPSKGSSGD